jgi:hypothetical protein
MRAPPAKKRRLEAERTRIFTSITFSATQPASLKRVLSLRSIDDGDEDVITPQGPSAPFIRLNFGLLIHASFITDND